ncbi:MAG: TIM barrel protein [Akkermansiaceae bacterium]|nr:TIM barrel protein [Armatimonadota bacterium]
MSELKFSVAEWCFLQAQMNPEDFYRDTYRLGYRAADFVPAERWIQARTAGLEILNLGAPGMQDGINRAENHDVLIPSIRSAIATAKENHIPHVVVFSGNRTEGVSDEVGWENCRRALEVLAKDAEAAGVLLVLEMLNSFDHKDYQADSSRYGFDLVKAVDSPALRTLFDLYHLHRMGEDVLPVALENLSHIAHFHIAGSPARDYPDLEGAIDYRTILREIHAAGYRGYWGIEFLPRGEDVQTLLARFIGEYGGTVA